MTFAIPIKTFVLASAFASGMIAVTLANAAPTSLASLMVEEITPAANTLWNAAVKDTLSEEDWDEVGQAVTMLNAASVILAAGSSMPNERHLSKSPEWKEWFQKFTAILRVAKRASDSKDQQALITAGNSLVDVCEGCHRVVAAPPNGH